MGCERCEPFSPRIPISRPEDLTAAISLAKDAVESGVLAEVPHDGKWGPEFVEVEPGGPWEDVVGHDFVCVNCGQWFNLSAETYHGSGGRWEMMEPRR